MHDRELIASFPPWNLIVSFSLKFATWHSSWGYLSPAEQLRLMGFPESYSFPSSLKFKDMLLFGIGLTLGEGMQHRRFWQKLSWSWGQLTFNERLPWMTTSEWRLCKWLKQHMSCIISSCSEVTRKWRVCVASLGDRTLREAATWFQTIMSKGCIFWFQAGRLDFRLQHQWATPRNNEMTTMFSFRTIYWRAVMRSWHRFGKRYPDDVYWEQMTNKWLLSQQALAPLKL